MLQKPHGNLQIKRTCVAFRRRLGFLSPPDLNSTPWDTPKVEEKGPQPSISPRLCPTEALARCPTRRPTTPCSGTRSPPRWPHTVGPWGGHGPGVTVWGPSGQTYRPGTWQVSVRLETYCDADERQAQQARPPRALSQNFFCNLNQFSELAGRLRGHRKQARRRVPNAGRPGLSPGRKSPLGACPGSQHGLPRWLHAGALPSAPRGPGR